MCIRDSGGTADVIARTLATSMSELLGQPVVVENKTGASGSIGTMAVKQAPPDGHTLLLTTIGTVVLAPMVTKDASFDPVKGLTPIANLAMAPIVLLVHQSVPANDFPGFVTWAKQQAKGVDIAVAGPTPEVATALLAQQAKLNLVTVPFRGYGPALQSVLAGDTKVIFQAPSVQMMEFIKQGKLKVIGVTSAMQCASSSAVCRQFMHATIAPTFAAASRVSTNSRRFSERIATRSPRATPCTRSHADMRATCSPSCAYVQSPCGDWTATACGLSATWSSNTCRWRPASARPRRAAPVQRSGPCRSCARSCPMRRRRRSSR